MSDNVAVAAAAAGIVVDNSDYRNAVILALSLSIFAGYQILKYGFDRFLQDIIDFIVEIPFWWMEQLVGVARVFIEELIPDLVTTTGNVVAGVKWFDMSTLETPNLF